MGTAATVLRALIICVITPLTITSGATAQANFPVGPLSGQISQVLTLNQDRFFAQSDFGIRVVAEFEDLSAKLAQENRRIEMELEAEELALTEQRFEISADEFRALADAFDEKVIQIREQQNAKSTELNTNAENERQRFFEEAVPVMVTIMDETGAAVVIDQRSVLISAQNIDVTDLAIERVNAVLGNGLN